MEKEAPSVERAATGGLEDMLEGWEDSEGIVGVRLLHVIVEERSALVS